MPLKTEKPKAPRKFRGNHEHSIDEKGRLSVPTRFRDVIRETDDGQLIITKGSHGCLSVYPLTRWEAIEDDIDQMPAGDEKDYFLRHHISSAQECPMDKMGRVLIPSSLRKAAKLEKDVMVVGVLSRFEIWNITMWEKHLAETESRSQDILKGNSIRL